MSSSCLDTLQVSLTNAMDKPSGVVLELSIPSAEFGTMFAPTLLNDILVFSIQQPCKRYCSIPVYNCLLLWGEFLCVAFDRSCNFLLLSSFPSLWQLISSYLLVTCITSDLNISQKATPNPLKFSLQLPNCYLDHIHNNVIGKLEG